MKFGLVPLFFPRSERVAGSIRVFDDGSGIRGRSPMLLWDVAFLSVSASELRSWHRYPPSPCRLWSVIWSQFSLLVVFLEVLNIVARLALIDSLLRSHHQHAPRDVTIGASVFSLRKNAYMQTEKLVLVSHLLDVFTFVRRRM